MPWRGQAQRLADPPALGPVSGTIVDPVSGRLTVGVPIGVVPGEIPVAVSYRINGAPMTQRAQIWSSIISPNWDGHTIPPPMVISLANTTWLDRPAYGTVHFGYISNAVTWANPEVGTGVSEPARYVLEDGRSYVDSELKPFTKYNATFTLAEDFGLAAKSPSQLEITNDSTTVVYAASATDLGTWASKITLPSGFNSGGYVVVMDRDKARIFYGGLPVLWLDRFGHYVKFTWTRTAGTLAGMTAKVILNVANQRGRGLCIQWADWSSTTQVQDLIRIDFVGMSGPSLQVRGYPGASANRPASLPGANPNTTPDNNICICIPDSRITSPLGRPTQIQLGSPSIPIPAWDTNPPVAPPVSDKTVQAVDTRTWILTWSDGNSVLNTVTDPLGTISTFTYGLVNFGDPAYTATAPEVRLAGVYCWGIKSMESTENRKNVSLTNTWDRSGVQVTAQSTYGPDGQTPLPTRELVTTYNNLDLQFPAGILPVKTVINALSSSGSETVMDSITYSDLDTWGLDQNYPMALTVDHVRDGEQTIHQTFGRLPEDTASPCITGTILSNSSIGVFSTSTSTQAPAREKLQPHRLKDAFQDRYWTSYTYTTAKGLIKSVAKAYETVSGSSQSTIRTYFSGTFNTWDETTGQLTKAVVGKDNNVPASPVRYQTYQYDGEGLPNKAVTTYLKQIGTSGTATLTESSTHDPAGRVVSATDARGAVTTTTYDLLGRPTKVTKTGEAAITYAYPDAWTTQVTANGVTATEHRDGFGRVIKRTRPDGTYTEYTYDSCGRLATTKDYANTTGKPVRTTTTSYDALDRPKTTTTPDGIKRTWVYAAKAAPVGLLPGFNAVTQTITGTDGSTSRSTTTYRTLRGEVAYVVDPKGVVTTYSYDSGGLPIGVKRPGEGSRSYQYDPAGRLVTRISPEDGTTGYGGFNELNQPTSVTETGTGQTPVVRTRTLKYDGLGRVLSETNGYDGRTWTYTGLDLTTSTTGSSAYNSVSQQFVYDASGRRREESTTLNNYQVSTPHQATIKYKYNDTTGLFEELTYPSGRVIRYGYDSLSRVNQVSQIKDNGGSAVTKVLVSAPTYDPWGNVVSLSYTSGVKDVWGYGNDGLRLQSWDVQNVSSTTLDQLRSYEYDVLGRFKTAGEWSGIEYDTQGHLTSTTNAGLGQMMCFTYDDLDNQVQYGYGTIKGATPSWGVMQFSVPMPVSDMPSPTVANNRVSAMLGSSALSGWAYNGWGEATQWAPPLTNTTQTMVNLGWDGVGRMSAAQYPSGSSRNNQYYTYDAAGLRVQTRDSVTANNRRYAYAGTGQLLTEYTTDANFASVWKRDVVYLGGRAIAEIDAAGIHELHCDYQGTPRVITKAGLTAAEGKQAFHPFGERDTQGTSGYLPLTGYTGHVQTDITGLIYMRGRYYCPAWRRFVSSDLGKDPNSVNQYAYVLGNPFMMVDPSGWNTEQAKWRLSYIYYSGNVTSVDFGSENDMLSWYGRQGFDQLSFDGYTEEKDNGVGKDVNYKIRNYWASRNSETGVNNATVVVWGNDPGPIHASTDPWLSQTNQDPSQVLNDYRRSYRYWQSNLVKMGNGQYKEWGLVSDCLKTYIDSSYPDCLQYSDALTDFLNQHVKIPGAFAQSEIADGFFMKNSHYVVGVYMNDSNGKPVLLDKFDPWNSNVIMKWF